MLSLAKNVYEFSPSWLRQLAWKIPQPFLLTPSYWALKKQLARDSYLGAEERQSLQHRLLASALAYAAKNVPFYQSRFGRLSRIEDFLDDPVGALQDFPIISKDDLRDNVDDFISTKVNKGQRYLATTGGSTGEPLKIWLANSVWAVEWAFVYDLLSAYGISPSDCRISLRGVRRLTNNNSFYEENPLYHEIRLSPFTLTRGNLPGILALINKSQPKFLHGYPSAVRDLLTLLGEDCREILKSIRVILVVSENLPRSEAQHLAEISGVPVTSFYGHSERACFAPWVESAGKWIPHWRYGVTELRDGRIITTGFINPAMPLVRYDTGDLASNAGADRVLVPGEGFPAIEGRWNQDFMIGRSGQRITMTALNTHIAAMRWVRKFQFHQIRRGEAILHLMMVDHDNKKDLSDIIRKEFQKKCNDELLISVKLVEDIPLSRLGKHAFIIRNPEVI